jgi:mono/diheme cytochrome c family protein
MNTAALTLRWSLAALAAALFAANASRAADQAPVPANTESAPAAPAPATPESAPAAAAPAPEAAAPAEAPAKPKIDVRKLFAMNCSWCHDGYGMHAGKGPKLAGTSLTAAQVYQRIAKGKSGAMPGFEKTLKPEQIEAFVEYIKGLKDSDS